MSRSRTGSPGKVATRDRSRRPQVRGGRGAGAGRPPSPAPEKHTLFRRRGILVAAIVAVLGAVAIVVAVIAGGDDDPTAARVAELQAAEDARQAELIIELNDLTLDVHADLLPVLADLHDALPADGSPGVEPEASEVAEWRAVVGDAIAEFDDPPSASTEFNMARNGLLLSIELLESALSAYESALAFEGAERANLEELAVGLRQRAVDAWAVAATHLDVLNIDAGHGHVHIYLPIRPGEDVSDPHDHGTHGDQDQHGDHDDH